MKLVVADTSPVNYLILIGHIDLLPRLFKRVILPTAVQVELSAMIAPGQVRRWVASPPPWIEIMEANSFDPREGLDKGEAAAISLASCNGSRSFPLQVSHYSPSILSDCQR